MRSANARFDLIFVLRDTRNEEWDRTVSGFVLENKIPSEELSKVERDNKRTPGMNCIKIGLPGKVILG